MDRIIVYPGAIPLDSDVLTTNKSTMVALGALMRAVVGTGTVIDGLAVAQTGTPGMSVLVGPGSIITSTTVDGTAYGTLASDTANTLMKMGIVIGTTTLGPVTAPGSAGQSQCFLVEAQFSEVDGGATVLDYYNPSNPSSPWSGPSNTGVSNNTLRLQKCLLQIKAGTAATTGTQVPPSPDAGWIGVAYATVAFGATSIVNANITTYAGAPIITQKVGVLNNGFSTEQWITSGSTPFIVPAGVTKLRVTIVGGGGAGGGGSGPSGGGGGGAMARSWLTGLTPGASISLSVGAGGTGGTGNGGAGGTTTFGSLTANGGAGGTAGSGTGGGGGGTAGSSGQVNWAGGAGQTGNATAGTGGSGGNSGEGGAGAIGGFSSGTASTAPGAGSSGNVGGGSAQSGNAGVIKVEY